jgi:hypothetical protein
MQHNKEIHMAGKKQGFSYVVEDGYIAFKKAMEKNAWGQIKPTTSSPLTASRESCWLLRFDRAFQNLLDARRPRTSLSGKEIDTQKWDPLQLRLDSETQLHLDRKDPIKKAAATKIREQLVIGGGRGQTKFALEKEVIHGRKQVFVARNELAAEIALLELDSLIDEIDEATEELAEATGDGSSTAQAKRVAQAVSQCGQSCSFILNDIDWLLEQPDTTTDEKAPLETLRKPLLELLVQYPPPAKPSSNTPA